MDNSRLKKLIFNHVEKNKEWQRLGVRDKEGYDRLGDHRGRNIGLSNF